MTKKRPIASRKGTPGSVKSEFAACSRRTGWRHPNIEQSSWLDSYGRIHTYRERILPGVVKLRDKRGEMCSVFITKAEGDLNQKLVDKPYELNYLCKKGCELTGKKQFATEAEAREVQRLEAAYAKKHPPRIYR